jgi:hypothetical protein
MKRTALVGFLVLACIAFTSAAVQPAYSNDAPPTNTRRPAMQGDTPTATPSITLSPSPTVTPTATLTLTPSITPTTIGPVEYPQNYNTLTGLPFPDEAARNRRNLIVKISNYPPVVRPQTGLAQADIVYEYEVEGGVTRFAAIYRSQGYEHVGSVRSGRLFDFDLVVIYQALYAFSGVNDNIGQLIREADWRFWTITPQFGDNCPPFCRFPANGLAYEHTMFGNTYQMWEIAERRNVNQGVNVRGFAFNETADPGGTPINDIAIQWFGEQDARWQYNPADGRYYRWNTGLPHMDASTGEQLSAANVILLEAHHVDRPDIYETESGTRTMDILLWGRGRAWVFRDGEWHQGYWIRRSRQRSGLALFYDEEGTQPMHLKPGNSWIEMIRCCTMPGVTLSQDYEDVLATGTPSAQTATAYAPRLPEATQTFLAPRIEMTNTASAATSQYRGTPVPSGTPVR